jgi:hypothetical protein
MYMRSLLDMKNVQKINLQGVAINDLKISLSKRVKKLCKLFME